MPRILPHLELPRCPHCQIDNPNLEALTSPFATLDHTRTVGRVWRSYRCTRCGGVIVAGAQGVVGTEPEATEIYPKPAQVDNSLPLIAREYLTQALNSLHAPAGSVMLCASSVDAMLKEKGYTEGSLYARINRAATDHLITEGMKDWAHEIRLDANDQRHADHGATLPTTADAQRNIEFAQALGQFLFALPARVAQGRAAVQSNSVVPVLSATDPASAPVRY